jgi:16S rRNA (cytosine967-C5)-methyltransferase
MGDPTLTDHDRSLLQKLVKGVLENRSYIDVVLAPCLAKGVDSLPPTVRGALRLGAYQILFLDRVHAGTAVNASVEMAKRFGGAKFGNLVNAVLRRVLREGASAAPGGTAIQRIAIEHSHPEWLVAHWVNEVGEAEAEELCRFNNTPWPLFARVNTLKAAVADCRRALENEGVSIRPGRWCEDVCIIESLPPGRKLDELESFRAGLFVIHDESSTMAARLVEPRPGETVIDVCSAPGGKTVHLAALMGNHGRLLAYDPSPVRVKLVEEACTRLGVSIVETKVGGGERLTEELAADRVLVDAPCSGLGVVGRRPDIRWHRRPEKFEEFQSLQCGILRGAARAVRVGGRLVYSTCTTSRVENEGTVERFLVEHPHFDLVPVSSVVPPEARTPEGFFRSWPQRHRMGGAFGAILERRR